VKRVFVDALPEKVFFFSGHLHSKFPIVQIDPFFSKLYKELNYQTNHRKESNFQFNVLISKKN
tara:strand:+ start:1456 stop:1644 length:189 start_codon:yes stop_codon:yes gene_type:complete